jgi:putative spermidine/putrescine transport system substrate-binding protein
MDKDGFNELIDDLGDGKIGRREFTRRAGVLGLSLPTIAALLAACGDDDDDEASESQQGRPRGGSLTMVSYGGSYNDNVQKSFLDPFTKETGIKVNLGENTALAQVKLQVQSNNVQWDIAELTGSEYEIGAEQGLFEELDYKKIDASSYDEQYRKPMGIKYALFLFIMAWDQREIPDDAAPEKWSEFFDPEAYETRRSLYDGIGDGSLLEAALIADGVSKDDLYPLDVDRAFARLDKLGYDRIIFHSTNQEPIQQLTSGEVALATSFTGRVIPAVEVDKAKIGYTPNEGAISGDYLVVPKGASEKERAFELLNFIASNAEAGAHYMELTTYATANKKALDLVPADTRKQLPTSPELADRVFLKDDAYWAENFDAVTRQFKEWQQGH